MACMTTHHGLRVHDEKLVHLAVRFALIVIQLIILFKVGEMVGHSLLIGVFIQQQLAGNISVIR